MGKVVCRKKKMFNSMLPFDLYDELKVKSKQMGVPMSVIISIAVRKYLEEGKKEKKD